MAKSSQELFHDAVFQQAAKPEVRHQIFRKKTGTLKLAPSDNRDPTLNAPKTRRPEEHVKHIILDMVKLRKPPTTMAASQSTRSRSAKRQRRGQHRRNAVYRSYHKQTHEQALRAALVKVNVK